MIPLSEERGIFSFLGPPGHKRCWSFLCENGDFFDMFSIFLLKQEILLCASERSRTTQDPSLSFLSLLLHVMMIYFRGLRNISEQFSRSI